MLEKQYFSIHFFIFFTQSLQKKSPFFSAYVGPLIFPLVSSMFYPFVGYFDNTGSPLLCLFHMPHWRDMPDLRLTICLQSDHFFWEPSFLQHILCTYSGFCTISKMKSVKKKIVEKKQKGKNYLSTILVWNAFAFLKYSVSFFMVNLQLKFKVIYYKSWCIFFTCSIHFDSLRIGLSP